MESRFGESIRADFLKDGVTCDGLSAWLLSTHKVRVSGRICQNWLSKDWSSSGALYTAEAVEEALGKRLRLVQYREQFQTDLHDKAKPKVTTTSR